VTATPHGINPDLEGIGPFPRIRQLQAARAARDWVTIRQTIDAHPSPDDRYVAVGVAGRAGDEEFYRAVVAANPGDPLALVLLGETLLKTGWEIRGAGWASQVKQQQFERFHEYLRQAEAVLIEATAIQPERAEAWTVRLNAARGLQLDIAEARRRYAHAARYEPHAVVAQRSLLQKLLPKWSGSWEQAATFARDCAAQAQALDGAANVLLIADLHVERLLDLPTDQHPGYLALPQVRAEILAAARSGPLHAQFRPGLLWKGAYNTFALLLALVGETAAAGHCFRTLDGHASEYPWAYFGDPVQQFASHRDRTLARA
jgi:hypothetical protein